MFKIKLENDRRGNLKFRAKIDEKLKENIIIKRAIFESKIIKSNKEYDYLIPMKFFIPIIKNLDKDLIKIDKDSVNSFLEFSDDYEEVFYYAALATSAYMKKWRDENCPKIYKIKIDKIKVELQKEIAFERLL